MTSRLAYAIIALLCISAADAAAQVEIGGQVRPRTEFRQRGSNEDAFTSMRTRISATGRPAPNARVFVQLQDVRFWGEEVNTTASLDNIDLHQAFVDVGSDSGRVALRAGRQELSYGEERLIGALDWVQSGRAFDGARVRASAGVHTVHVLGFQIADAVAAVPDERFYGLYYTVRPAQTATVELYGMHNRGGAVDLEQTTLGGRLSAAHGLVSYRVESAWQGGQRAGTDVRAYLLAGMIRVHALERRAQAALWYDRLSGDADSLDATRHVFDTLYGTNHKFYGLADVFTNIPVHTAGYGLQDAALKLSYAVTPSSTAALELHHMRSAADIPGVSDAFANEADLTLAHLISPKLGVQAGVSGVDALPGLLAVRPDQRSHIFAHLMLTASF